MTQPMLVDLADVLRKAGQQVEELPNWKTTSRSDDTSRYGTGRPNHLMWHHTATSTSAHSLHASCRREANSLQIAEPNEPVSNLGLCPHGVWFVIAAGPTNTNGIGDDRWHPVGDPKFVPSNSMNSYALAVEMMNNGIGEPYTEAMQIAAVIGGSALCRAYNIGVFENRAHFEWTDRKIDPAGPSQWAKTSDRYLRWDMGKFRDSLQREIRTAPPTNLKPYPKGKEMLSGIYDCSFNGGTGIKYMCYTSGKKIWISDQGMWEGAKALCAINGLSTEITTITDPGLFAAMGLVEGPNDPHCDEYGNKVR